jgi:PAS domain-containing protein
LLALPVAVAVSQVNQASYRSGAAIMAVLVVLGLGTRWTVSAGAAPVLLLGMCAQVSDDFRDLPPGSRAIGLVIAAASASVIVLALRRWEGDRRRAREEAAARRRNERRLEALVDFAHLLASVAHRRELLAAVEREITTTAGSSGAILVVRDRERVEFPVVTGHDPDDFPPTMPPGYVARGTPALDALDTDRAVFCPTAADLLRRYPLLADYVERTGLHGWAALPVPDLGALVLTWPEEQVFSPAQRAFLVTIASLLSTAAERVHAVERSELQRFVGAFDAMLDGVGIHRAVRDASGRIIDLEVEYMNRASVDIGADRSEIIGQRMSEIWSDSPLLAHYARVIETGEPFVLEDADVASLGGPPSEVTTVSIRASRLDPDRIVLVVRDVSERARLIGEIEEANEVFAAAQQLAHVGSWRYDFPTDRLEWSDELYRIVGVPKGAPPVRPTEGSLFGFEHPEDRGRVVEVIAEALEDRSSFIFDMRIIRQDDGEIRDVSTTGTVLVDDQGNVTGVWGATQDVTERRRAERARREALDALAHEREAVAELQRVILPAELPEVPGMTLTAHYRATLSNAVGGDWYDAFTAPDGRIVIAIGDVAGHGIECAATANQLRVSVRIRVNDGMEPGAILSLLDAELGDGFVTCLLATFDPATRELRFANAGHLPALLIRDGTTDFVAARTSPPLGTQRVDSRAGSRLVLEPDDLVVLYTDGLIERRGESLERGLDRLARIASVLAEVGDPAFTFVEALAPDAADDVCVMTLRVQR